MQKSLYSCLYVWRNKKFLLFLVQLNNYKERHLETPRFFHKLSFKNEAQTNGKKKHKKKTSESCFST